MDHNILKLDDNKQAGSTYIESVLKRKLASGDVVDFLKSSVASSFRLPVELDGKILCHGID
jgi:hypothetical protein